MQISCPPEARKLNNAWILKGGRRIIQKSWWGETIGLKLCSPHQLSPTGNNFLDYCPDIGSLRSPIRKLWINFNRSMLKTLLVGNLWNFPAELRFSLTFNVIVLTIINLSQGSWKEECSFLISLYREFCRHFPGGVWLPCQTPSCCDWAHA